MGNVPSARRFPRRFGAFPGRRFACPGLMNAVPPGRRAVVPGAEARFILRALRPAPQRVPRPSVGVGEWRMKGQKEAEDRAAPGFAAHRYDSLVLFENPLGDPEAEARPL